MIILAADTTTPSGSVAFFRDADLIGEIDLESPSTHSARLLKAIDFLIRAAGLDIRDVDGFAVAAGPGSFTGIRIGLAAIKSLAYASGRPAVPVSTLEALAWKLAGPQNGLVCPILDAKKGEIYGALFEAGESLGPEIIPQGAYDPAAFFARLPAGRIVSFIGGGLDVYRELLPPRLKDKARFPLRSPFIAAEVGRLGFAALRAGKGIDSRSLEPLYFRKSQAEENKSQ